MLDIMVKNVLAGLGITEADMLKAKDDFALLAKSARQLSENQQLVYDGIQALRAEVAALRAEINPGFAGGEFPAHMIPLNKDAILNPQPLLFDEGKNHGH